MASMKFHTTESPDGSVVAARIFAGPDDDQRRYAGTIVLPAPLWEQFLDRVVFGAAQMANSPEALRIFFGPDDEDAR